MIQMNSKQEKLAAARKKLKEFQGKQRDLDNSKQNISESSLNVKYENSTFDTAGSSSIHFTLNTDGTKSLEYGLNSFSTSSENYLKANFQENNKNKFKQSELLPEDKNLTIVELANSNDNKHMPSEILSYFDKNAQEKIITDSGNSKNNFNKSSLSFSSVIFDNFLQDDNTECHKNHNMLIKECDSVNQIKEIMSVPLKEFTTQFIGNDTLSSLQLELQNHIKTINILIEQRNDIQNNLIQVQGLLNEKSGEVEQQKQSIINLTFEIDELHKKLSDLNTEYKNLKSESEKTLEKNKEAQSNLMLLQCQFDAKSEEFLELNKKYEEKKSECEQLKSSLNESQSQLSLCLIQLQQLSNEENSELSLKISDLQHDNLSLRQQFENLKKQLEIVCDEKDQSEQKFHVYAQQCNSQLRALNSQITCLTTENEKVKQYNDSLLHKLTAVENENKEKLLTGDNKNKIGELHSQINILMQTNKNYQDNCEKKVEEIKLLSNKIHEKENEIKNLTDLLKKANVEKQNLLVEMETPKASKQLLASIESDKIAAAKAVSQNQKLKSQVMELEKAFVKLSEEKLKLTDQLSHEKHINKELLDKIETLNSSYHYHQNNCHHFDQSENLSKNKEGGVSEILVNDSSEIEELRKIIRQLQNDKMELKARLNKFANLKNSDELHNGLENLFIHELNKNELENKNSKLLLHQMEEKVRKTMNEIAILDEEKEKLEHLVMQLQGETETIGEYITLYQRQRMLLRQRAQEKDNQLIQLSKDKEELRSKLVTLDELVQLLVKERKSYYKQTDVNHTATTIFKDAEEQSTNTAGKIRALINEIGTTNLINNQSLGIEHCSCCSGRLITI